MQCVFNCCDLLLIHAETNAIATTEDSLCGTFIIVAAQTLYGLKLVNMFPICPRNNIAGIAIISINLSRRQLRI